MYQNATIITLSPPSKEDINSELTVSTSSFDEVFDEYSELRGKGRARRQARKLERQEKKAERKVARQTTKQAKIKAKQETKQLKRGGRQEARIARRATRKAARQDMRNSQQESRMNRRGNRLNMRQERATARQTRKDTKALGEEGRENLSVEQSTYRDNMLNENENLRENQNVENEAYRNSLNPEETQDEQGYDEGADYSEEQGYDDGGEYYDEGADYSEEQGYDDGGEYYDEEQGYDESGDYYPEEEAYDDGGEYFEPFDGELKNDNALIEISDSKKVIEVNPKIQDIANKIEWNKKLIELLKVQRANSSTNKSDISKKIIERQKRVGELESSLTGYECFDGDFLDASGPAIQEKRKRQSEIARARNIARQIKRESDSESTKPVKSRASQERYSSRAAYEASQEKYSHPNRSKDTLVNPELKPEFSKERIEIPASSNATGIIGIDDADDFDARELDIQLGADGVYDNNYNKYAMTDDEFSFADGKMERTINWKGVILGIGLGALAIYGIRKFKLIK